jgi:valyl-tRNA synthetase
MRQHQEFTALKAKTHLAAGWFRDADAVPSYSQPDFIVRYRRMRGERVFYPIGLWESFRVLLGLFAPFTPFLTEHMYQRFYREHEDAVSLHLTRWPEADPQPADPAGARRSG